MTDKQINKFSDLTFTQILGYDLVATFNNNRKIKELQEQLKAKEQECERLKTKIINWLGREGIRETEKEFYEQQLDQLKADNKVLTEQLAIMKSQSALLPAIQFEKKCSRLEKAIEKIKELIQKEINDCEHCEDCASCEYNCCTQQILQICDEVNDEPNK